MAAGGSDTLRSKGNIVRKRDLSLEQEHELAALVDAGAVASGLPTEVWTLPGSQG